MKFSFARLGFSLAAIAILFSDFEISSIKISFLFFPVAIILALNSKQLKKEGLLFFLLSSTYSLILLFDSIQKFKATTLIMTIIFWGCVSLTLFSKNKTNNIRPAIYFSDTLVKVFSLHAVFLLLQSIELNIFHSENLLNPFGQFSSPGPSSDFGEPYAPYFGGGYVRPNGFFSEPSVSAWMTSIVLVVGIIFRSEIRRIKLYILILAFGILATGSASGLVNLLFIIWLSLLIYQKNINSQLRNKVVVNLILVLLVLSTITILSDRLEELTRSGASLNIRITAPIMILKESLVANPFGHALGNLDFVTNSRLMINFKEEVIARFDNTALFLIYYYGYVGLFFVLLFIPHCLKKTYQKNKEAFLLSIVIFISFMETGGGFTPKFLLISLLSIITCTLYLDIKKTI